jgi:hypothetical protein
MKNRVVEDLNSQWGDSGTTAWGATDTAPAWQNNDSFSTPAQPVDDTPVEGIVFCRLLLPIILIYKFSVFGGYISGNFCLIF